MKNRIITQEQIENFYRYLCSEERTENAVGFPDQKIPISCETGIFVSFERDLSRFTSAALPERQPRRRRSYRPSGCCRRR